MDAQLALMLSQLDYNESSPEYEEKLTSTKTKVIKCTDISTKIYPKMLSLDEYTAMFVYLKENIRWAEGIKTRSGEHTRLAANYQSGNDKCIS